MPWTLEPDDPHLLAMIQALPPVADGQVVKLARAAWLGMIQGSTPGSVEYPFPTDLPSDYRDIFFPEYSPAPYQADLLQQMPWLNEGWWTNFTIALLCQTMFHILADSYSVIIGASGVDTDVDQSNADLMSVATQWYTHVFSQDFTDFTTPFQTLNTVLSDDNHPDPSGELRDGYIQVLTSDAWINARNVMAQLGTWSDAAWEMYHHWIKLTLLGATNDDIGSVISQQQAKGLDVPNPDVTFSDNWANYLAWVDPLTWQDVQNLAQGSVGMGGGEPGTFLPPFFVHFVGEQATKYGIDLSNWYGN